MRSGSALPGWEFYQHRVVYHGTTWVRSSGLSCEPMVLFPRAKPLDDQLINPTGGWALETPVMPRARREDRQMMAQQPASMQQGPAVFVGRRNRATFRPGLSSSSLTSQPRRVGCAIALPPRLQGGAQVVGCFLVMHLLVVQATSFPHRIGGSPRLTWNLGAPSNSPSRPVNM